MQELVMNGLPTSEWNCVRNQKKKKREIYSWVITRLSPTGSAQLGHSCSLRHKSPWNSISALFHTPPSPKEERWGSKSPKYSYIQESYGQNSAVFSQAWLHSSLFEALSPKHITKKKTWFLFTSRLHTSSLRLRTARSQIFLLDAALIMSVILNRSQIQHVCPPSYIPFYFLSSVRWHKTLWKLVNLKTDISVNHKT